MPVSELRPLLRRSISALKDHGRHEDLPEICKQLGLLPPGEGSKREKLKASFDAVPDAELPDVAERFLLKFPPSASVRNEIQELLWADSTGPEISKKCRHELARSLQPENLYRHARHFMDLIERLWVIDGDPFDMICGERRTQSLRAQIERHVINNHDWDGEVLFEKIGAFTCTNHRFILFLEGLASADVRRDEAEQHSLVTLVNVSLGPCRIELRETANEGGYPVFRIVTKGTGIVGRPKNLIFGSPVKPDLRFRDAVNNDIEIVSNADRVLVYDWPIPSQGLRWDDLQDWWAEHENYNRSKPREK